MEINRTFLEEPGASGGWDNGYAEDQLLRPWRGAVASQSNNLGFRK